MKLKTKVITLASLITLSAVITGSVVYNNHLEAQAAPKTSQVSRAPREVSTTNVSTTASESNEDKVTTAVVDTEPAQVEPAVKPSSIEVKGVSVSYKNTTMDELQGFINANHDMVGTFYGSAFSGEDGSPTHFAGHDFGKFGVIKQLTVGDEVKVTDEHSKTFTYVVSETYVATAVYENGEGYLENPADIEFITRQMNAGTEMVYLQTCASEVVNGSFDIFYAVAIPKAN